MEKKRFLIKINYNELGVLLYVILVFFTPGPIALRTIIYRVSADKYFGSIGWLGYTFGALSILALLTGIKYLFSYRNNDINIGTLVLYLFLWNCIRVVIGASNIFSYNDYSLFLSLITGYGGYILLKRYVHYEIEDAFDLIVILNFVTQCINIFAGRQLEYGGRYAAIGSTTGSVGIMCASYLIYYLFCRKNEKRSMISILACVLSILLAGSRFNLMIAIIFIILFAFKLRKGLELNDKKRKTVIILILVGILVVPFAYSYLGNTIFSKLLNRTEDVIGAILGRDTSYVTDDLSFNARLLSLKAGLETIIENPLGISTSSIDLQAHTIKHGFTYFPHSTLISYYLLWGIPAIIIFVSLINHAVKAIKNNNTVWILALYFLVSFVLYGGPIIESKMYLWYFLMFDFIKNEANSTYSCIENRDHIASIKGSA